MDLCLDWVVYIRCVVLYVVVILVLVLFLLVLVRDIGLDYLKTKFLLYLLMSTPVSWRLMVF